MTKKLSDMSLQELWELFPIVLTPHQSCWKSWYEEEEKNLMGLLGGERIWKISQIGSTCISTIWAKPIIDILLEIPPDADMEEMKTPLIYSGYVCMSQGSRRISFQKGYTENGFAQKVFHLHLRYAGDHDELYFRDYLQEHPDVAKEYETLKRRLWKEFEHNRDSYTDAKTEFVLEYTKRAKAKYQGRY